MLSARARSGEREEGIKAAKGELEEALWREKKRENPWPREGCWEGTRVREKERSGFGEGYNNWTPPVIRINI